MKNEKSELQKMIDRLRTRRSEFIKKKMAERRKQLIDAIGDVGVTPEYHDIDLLTPETLTEIEITFNEAIAACREKIRQLEKVETERYFETVPATIEKLKGEVERQAAELRKNEAELSGLENSLRNHTTRQNAGIDHPVVYNRRADVVFDARLANMKAAHINHIVNY